MNHEEAGKIVAILCAAYQREVSQETVTVYVSLLLDLPFGPARAATSHLVATSRFFPTVAEIREATMKLLPDGRVPSAAEAWEEVRTALNSWEPQPAFSHLAIDRTVSAMGWRELCISENPIADRAHFLKLYEEYAKRASEMAATSPEVRALLERALPGRIGPPGSFWLSRRMRLREEEADAASQS